MRRTAPRIRGELNRVLQFPETNYRVYDSQNQWSRHMERLILKKRHDITERVQIPLSSATCLYCADLDIGFDYGVFIYGRMSSAHCYLGIAEEITHGEHMVVQAKDPKDYYSKFSEAFIELIGHLGKGYIFQNRKGARRGLSRGDCNRLLFKRGFIPLFPALNVLGDEEQVHFDLSHYIGYSIAAQLLLKRDVPLNEIFWASDQKKGWEIITSHITPKIVDSEQVFKELKKPLEKVIKEMGFRPEFEFKDIDWSAAATYED